MNNGTDEWYPEYVTTGFIAKRFGVSNTTVLRWIEKGILTAFKLPGGQNRIHRDVLHAFMAQNGMPVTHTHLPKQGNTKEQRDPKSGIDNNTNPPFII